MNEQPKKQKERNIILRRSLSVLWFVPIYFVTNAIISLCLGVMITIFHPQDFLNAQEGYNYGYEYSQGFFQKYSFVIFIFQALLTFVLSLFEILPGTGKFKKNKKDT